MPRRLRSGLNREAENGILRATIVTRVMEIGIRILLVDDDDDLRGLLRTVLKYNGFSVTEARTGNLAMGLLRSQQFDLVLLDITLPDGNGFRVAEFLRENKFSSKVIVITGTGGLENAVRGASFGVRDYISKPFTPQYLLRSIEHVLSIEVPN